MTFTAAGLDALPPAEVALEAEAVDVAKAEMRWLDVFVLAVLAGAFIALGAIFADNVAAGGTELPYGVVRLLAGLVFTLGLILVIVAGAELFTGNNLIVMAWASRRVSAGRLLGNLATVWIGNFIGAVATAVVLFVSEQYTFGGGAVGQTAVSIASAKTSLGFAGAVALGMLCNALVASPSGSRTAHTRRRTRSSRSSRRSPRSSPRASSTRSRTCTSSQSGC